jgi:hypothetical protein
MVGVSSAAGVLLLIVIYAVDAGHGFIKDDFQWIATSRIVVPGDLSRLLAAPTGFFRPVVSLSFAANYAMFGLWPRGYGLTNLALLLACVVVIVRLLYDAGIRREVAIASGMLWALNFHGINMSVLWISGRTALLAALFAAAAASFWLRGRTVVSGAVGLLAMLSKEEAFALPAILTVWSWLNGANRRTPTAPRRIVRETWPAWAAFAVALAWRTSAGAYTPATAPAVYQYQFDAATFGANALSYLDRVATTPAAALLLFWIVAGRGLRANEERSPDPASYTDRRIVMGIAWLVLSFAPTILLPVRSSLYALLPGVGVTIVAAQLFQLIVERRSQRGITRASLVLFVLFFALIPVYRLRNARYVNEAKLSAAVVRELASLATSHPGGGLVVVRDQRDARPTAEQAFGALADRAASVVSDGKLQMWIDPPPAELAGMTPPNMSSAIATLLVEDGNVRTNP